MYPKLFTLTALMMFLVACGGGGGSNPLPAIPLDQVQISESTVQGVSESKMIAYLQEMVQGPWGPAGNQFGEGVKGFFLWQNAPVVRTETGAHPEYRRMVERAVDQLNDWLPVENRMVMGESTDRQPQGATTKGYGPVTWEVPEGEIHVSFRYAFSGGVQHPLTSMSHGPLLGTRITSMVASLVEIAPDRLGGHSLYGVIMHELIHALGLQGHVSEVDHPDTLMPNVSIRGLPNEAGLQDIPRIDGEALMTAYSRYTDAESKDDINSESLGVWASGIPAISAKIRMEGGDISFGAEYRSQWVRAWDEGPMPSAPLSESGLTGTATWDGDLIGFTDSGVSAHGDAEITIEMQTMTGDAEFSNIMSQEVSWGPDLLYSISVNGNYLTATDTNDSLTGQFRGSNHEAVTGALATNNLTGAFGATR